ncbi:UNVERIFIED_CONTAM: hypothetical protein HDU68_007449 [Siphonaria sp. JEL0065]|nr:hypothetical protein HDU68_007449 [Siphonaria sp. JEL0065]
MSDPITTLTATTAKVPVAVAVTETETKAETEFVLAENEALAAVAQRIDSPDAAAESQKVTGAVTETATVTETVVETVTKEATPAAPAALPKRNTIFDKLRVNKKSSEAVAAGPSTESTEEKALPTLPKEQKVPFFANFKKNFTKAGEKFVEAAIVVEAKAEEAVKKNLRKDKPEASAPTAETVATETKAEEAFVVSATESAVIPVSETVEETVVIAAATTEVKVEETKEQHPPRAKSPFFENLKKNFTKAGEKAVEVALVAEAKAEEGLKVAKKNLEEQNKKNQEASAAEAASVATDETKVSTSTTTPKAKTPFFAALKKNFAKAGEKAVEVAIVAEAKAEEGLALAKKNLEGQQRKSDAVGASAATTELAVAQEPIVVAQEPVAVVSTETTTVSTTETVAVAETVVPATESVVAENKVEEVAASTITAPAGEETVVIAATTTTTTEQVTVTEQQQPKPKNQFFDNLKKNFAKASEKAVEVAHVVEAKAGEGLAAAKKNLQKEKLAETVTATETTKVEETAAVETAPTTEEVVVIAATETATPASAAEPAKPTKTPFFATLKKNLAKAGEKAVEVAVAVEAKAEEGIATAKKNLTHETEAAKTEEPIQQKQEELKNEETASPSKKVGFGRSLSIPKIFLTSKPSTYETETTETEAVPSVAVAAEGASPNEKRFSVKNLFNKKPAAATTVAATTAVVEEVAVIEKVEEKVEVKETVQEQASPAPSTAATTELIVENVDVKKVEEVVVVAATEEKVEQTASVQSVVVTEEVKEVKAAVAV